MGEDPFGPELAIVRMLADRPDDPWLRALPDLVAAVEREWGVTTEAPWRHGHGGWTAPARTDDGRRVVLKLTWPHPEAAGEAAALRHWSGSGAVRLLRHDPQRWALLLARCDPGTSLGDDDGPEDDRLAAAASVLRRLWAVPLPDPPLPSDLAPEIVEAADAWADLAEQRLATAGGRYDRALAAHGIGLLRELPRTATSRTLVHGDANPGNLLRDGDRWVAIDPKPMVGDPAYDPWPLLAQLGDPFAAPDPAAAVSARVVRFADLVALPAERLLAWSLARCVEAALWDHAHGRPEVATTAFGRARVLADLLG